MCVCVCVWGDLFLRGLIGALRAASCAHLAVVRVRVGGYAGKKHEQRTAGQQARTPREGRKANLNSEMQ